MLKYVYTALYYFILAFFVFSSFLSSFLYQIKIILIYYIKSIS